MRVAFQRGSFSVSAHRARAHVCDRRFPEPDAVHRRFGGTVRSSLVLGDRHRESLRVLNRDDSPRPRSGEPDQQPIRRAFHARVPALAWRIWLAVLPVTIVSH
jgi:hypothetical protein